MRYNHLDLLPENAFTSDPLGRITLEGGGGGQPSNTTSTVTNTTELPKEAKPLMSQMLTQSEALAQEPYQQYTEQRIAGLTPEHNAALNLTTQRSIDGNPAMNAASSHTAGVFNDEYMNRGLDLANQTNSMFGQGSNLASNDFIGQGVDNVNNNYIGLGVGGTSNPYIGQNTNVGSNQYAGSNPYLENAISKTLGDVTENYNDVINPQLAAMDRASGAYGNTGVNQTRSKSISDLSENLGNISSNMRMQDYSTQQQLAESDVNRRLQAQQNDLSRNSNLAQNQDQFNAGLLQSDISRNAALTDSQNQFNAGLQSSDLARNAGIAQDLSKYNSSLQQADISRNAQLENSQNQFNAGLESSDLQRNANLQQNLSQYNTGLQANDLARSAQLTDSQNQFNAGLESSDLARNANLAQNLSQYNTGLQAQDLSRDAGLDQQRLNMQAMMYGNERNNQMGALEFAPQLAAEDYSNYQNLLGVGDIYRQNTQQGLDFNYDQWLQQQQHPYKQLDILGSALANTVGGNASSVSSAPSPYAINPTANMIGTGMAGYGALQGLL